MSPTVEGRRNTKKREEEKEAEANQDSEEE
jgi:hypothetical protein